MKIAITRAGGYDPALGPKHPSNQDPTLEAHVVEIEPYNHLPEDGPNGTAITYQWVCSCGRRGPLWITEASSARNGGARHVAAMERGR